MHAVSRTRVGLCAAAVVVAIAGCKGGGGGGGGGPLGARATTLAPVLSTVPADAQAVFHLPAGLFALLPASAEADAREGMLEDTAELRDGDGDEPIFGALVEQMAAGPGAIGRTLGWQPGTSEVVAWGRGTTGVLRVRLDGAALRASLARAERSAKRTLAAVSWKGRAYYPLVRAKDAKEVHVAARIDDHELLLLWTRDLDRDLPLLMNDAPPSSSFDPTRVVEAMFPGRGAEAHFAMMVDPRWFTDIVAEMESAGALDDAGELGTPCGRTVLGLFGRLPAFHWAWARSATATELASTIQIGHPAAEQLTRDLSPIPRWAAKQQDLAMGIGVAPTTVLAVVEPWVERVDQAISACGGELGLTGQLRMVAKLPPLAAIRSMSITMDPVTENAVVAVRPDDVTRFWAQLRSLGPLRVQPPAIGEHVQLPGMVVTTDGDSLLVAVGEDEGMLDRAPVGRGPAALAMLVVGEDALAQFGREEADEDDEEFLRWVKGMSIELGVRDDRLVSRWVFQHR